MRQIGGGVKTRADEAEHYSSPSGPESSQGEEAEKKAHIKGLKKDRINRCIFGSVSVFSLVVFVYFLVFII